MKSIGLTLLLVLFSVSSFALQKQESYTLPDSTYALPLSGLERATKSGLIKIRLLNPTKFFELKKQEEENSELYQSYIFEVDEALWGKSAKNYNPKISFYDQFLKNSKLDLAKKVAKFEMLKMIQKNWPALKETIFNEYGAETWKQARALTLRKLDEIFFYSPRHPNAKTHYLFLFGDSFIQLDKATLKKVRVVLDINSRLDANRLPPDAANIIPAESDYSPSSNGSGSNKYNHNTDSNSDKKESPSFSNDNGAPAPIVNDLEIF